jgi:hypothetical protein
LLGCNKQARPWIKAPPMKQIMLETRLIQRYTCGKGLGF